MSSNTIHTLHASNIFPTRTVNNITQHFECAHTLFDPGLSFINHTLYGQMFKIIPIVRMYAVVFVRVFCFVYARALSFCSDHGMRIAHTCHI